jgi:type IV pilus assembly protein PilV
MFKQPIICSQRGVTLIEVLVTVIILSVGLLGIVGLQSRLQTSEMEAYQRSQALLLLNDMASRIAVNRNAAADYAPATFEVGAGINNCPTTTATQQQRDTGEWCEALKGAGELSSGSKVGALIGGRGCVESLGDGEYMVTVAWQGLMPLAAPPESVACGKDSYDGPAGSVCTGDLCRRVVTTIVRVADL